VTIDDFKAIPGKGVEGKYNSGQVMLGNRPFLNERNIKYAHVEKLIRKLENEGKTIVFLAMSKKIIGLMAIADTLKPSAFNIVEKLKKRNIKVWMVTGDNKITANAIAKQLGIEHVFAEVLPGEKAQKVKELKQKDEVTKHKPMTLAFIGDGINDAPALASSDV
jgi:Cu+-exporting ATPase